MGLLEEKTREMMDYHEGMSKAKLVELRRLRADTHKIGEIVECDREYLKHTFCYNQLKQLLTDSNITTST